MINEIGRCTTAPAAAVSLPATVSGSARPGADAIAAVAMAIAPARDCGVRYEKPGVEEAIDAYLALAAEHGIDQLASRMAERFSRP